jgi:DNA helicase-2/ATP-dependent DNA helicase PcrA
MSDFDFDFEPKRASNNRVYLDPLNDRQREAVLLTDGPLIVLAGAGSGKTKMLTSRISYLIESNGVPAYQVLAVTFTNKAAAEMRERVEKTLAAAHAANLGAPEIGTFHSVCVRLLRREMASLPFTKTFVIYDDSDQLSLIKSVMKKLDIGEKTVNPKAVQGAINRAKCDALEPKDIDPSPHNFFDRQFKRVYEMYEKEMIANNALDFGEIICMTYRLLRDHPEVRRKYQHRYRYIHVDEYQDTNRAQYLLLSMLAQERNGGHQNICVVGDEDQSIYKWRGADINNILDFERDYPGAQVVKLEQNYRSTKTIIQAAGDVIRNNVSRKDKTLWTENSDGEKIIRAILPDERAEAELAISEIKRLAQNDSRTYGEFAIFYRTNAQSRQFEDVFRREKIPYQIVGGLRFYDRKEIKDILSYFKAILNPSDSVSLKRIINVPGRGIGKTTLEKLDDYSKDHPELTYWEIVRQAASEASLTSAGTAKKLAQFVNLLNRLTEEQPKLLLSELYHLILDETGYVRELRAEATEESLARIENLEEFDTLLQEFDEDNFMNQEGADKTGLLPLFIEQSALASDVDQQDGQASAVRMMTLHSSKGLEFPVVFVVGMEEGLFPSIKPWEETPNEDIEEERRLCYVGMTRAREKLYLMSASMRRLWGDTNFNEPSRFFEEMPADLLEIRDYSNRFGSRVTTTARTDYEDDARGGTGSKIYAFPGKPAGQRDLVGRRLNHADYGPGTIIGVDGSGDDQKVTVEFRGRQQRKFLLRYVASYLE